MLMLVTVVVKTVENSGLFGHAKDAVEGWAEAERQEQEIGGNIDEIIAKYSGTQEYKMMIRSRARYVRKEEHNWKRRGDDIKCEHCELSFVIGDYLDYKPDETNQTITISNKESGISETEEGVSDNIFTQDLETHWQVLGVEDSDLNGTNETLLIKMDKGTATKLRLKGASAYNNGPDIMNKIAKELYSSSKYGEARSINITDLNNTLQYTPGGGFYIDAKANLKELSGFNTQISNIETWETVKGNGTHTPDGTNTELKLGSYTVNRYFYSVNTAGTGVENGATGEISYITENTRDVIFKTPTGENAWYWLACRGVGMDGVFAYFGSGAVVDGKAYSCYDTIDSGGYPGVYAFSIVPVVSLKSEIPNKITLSTE